MKANKMTIRKLFGVAGIAISFLTAGGTASAGHIWGPAPYGYHWARTSNPMPLRVVDSVTADWQQVLDESLYRWTNPEIEFIDYSSDDSSKARKRCQSVTGQMRVCNASYGFNGWLGLASINIESSVDEGGLTHRHIVKGTAKVNDSYSQYWANTANMNHVMCQEIGHVFGLGHTSTDGGGDLTCMDYSWDETSQWPNDHDYSQLAEMYNHYDEYNSYDDAEPVTGGGGGGDTKPCRGRNCSGFNAPEVPPMGVRVHRNDRHEIWVARGRDDSLWIHHVTLVPPEYR